MKKFAIVTALVLAFVGTALACHITFIGKGTVQTALGWNNAQLQAGADALSFHEECVSETTWSCTKTPPPVIPPTQQRLITTTTSSLLAKTSRTGPQGQVNGFNITGCTDTSVSTDGPALNSCPTGWNYNNDTTTVNLGCECFVNDTSLGPC